MDVQTPLICAGVVAVTSAVVYLSSVFGIRERTYEEAIEEQRRKNSLEMGVKTNKKEDKPKKEKKEKKKEKKEKKDKLKDKIVDPVGQPSEGTSISSDGRDVSATRKTEHVDFKPEPEVVLLNEDSPNETTIQRKTASNEKPIKPILTNKLEQNPYQTQTLAENVNGNGQRNSFDYILPKDELELLKEAKRTADREPVTEQSNSNVRHLEAIETPIVNGVNALESIQSESIDNELKSEQNKSDNSHTTSPARRSKRSKPSLFDGQCCPLKYVSID